MSNGDGVEDPSKAGRSKEGTVWRRLAIRCTAIALGVSLFGSVTWGLNRVLIWVARRDMAVFSIPRQEWTTWKGQSRWPVANVFSLGNRPDATEDYWNLRDELGFSAIVRPEGHVPPSIQKVPEWLRGSLLMPSRADGEFHLIVGNSNVYNNPGYFFFHVSRLTYWGDVLGVPGRSTDLEAFAVKEWLAALDGELSANPSKDITVTLCVTPQNDLEELPDEGYPPTARLRFQGPPESGPNGMLSRVSLRSAGQFVAGLLHWDFKTQAYYRQILGTKLFGNQRLFTPSVRRPEVRKLLYYVDDMAQTLERYASPERHVTLEIVTMFSAYDEPSRHFAYTWGTLFKSYAAGEFRARGSPPPRIQVRDVDIRDLIQSWFRADADYATLFYRQEQHYTTKGKARLALAWAVTAGYMAPPASFRDLAAAEDSLTTGYQRIAREVRSVAEPSTGPPARRDAGCSGKGPCRLSRPLP